MNRFISLIYELSGKINFYIGKHAGFLGSIYAVEFHKRRGIGTETVFFNKERYKDTIQQTNKIITVYPVKNIIGKSKRSFALYTVRFIENSYLIYFFFSYHILVIRAPIAFSLPSMFWYPRSICSIL